jgi:hypothetical protein
LKRLFRGGACWLMVLHGLALAAAASEPSRPLPRVFTISPQRLAETRTRVQGNDKSLKPAVDRLRRDATKALTAGPFSVMKKSLTPPSGDKHDYLSLAPYSWPNPDTKDGLPYINRDGQVNPESKVGTDSPALGQLSSSVQTLALAGYLIGDEAYAQHAAKLLRVWFLDPATRMNPHLNYGQGVRGRNDGRATGIIDTVSLVGVVDTAGLLESSPAWTAEDRQGMIAWCEAYLKWLRTSKLGQQESKATNNHGTWYDAQVASLALYVGQEEVARETLEASKHRRIDTQIEPDGSQPRELARTKSFGYSLYNLRALFTLASLGERVGVDLWHYRSQDGRGLLAALDFVAPYAEAEKKWPRPELHFERSGLLPFLQRAATVYKDPRYKQLLELLPADEVAKSRSRLLHP